MLVLGIDTSTKFLCLGIADGENILIDYNKDLDRRHSELLMPALTKLLKKAKLSLGDIDGFACGIGPGSFTGLRIGLSTIKGFVFGFKKPVLGISSLDIIAKNVDDEDKIICVIVDARRNLVYNAFYRIDIKEKKLNADLRESNANRRRFYTRNNLRPSALHLRESALKNIPLFRGRANNKLVRISKYKLSTIVDVLKFVGGPVVFLGDAVKLYEADIKKKLKKQAYFADEKKWYPRAGNLLAIAREKFVKKETTSLDKLLPLYLYPKECQIRQK